MLDSPESWPRHALPKGTVVQGFTIEAILGRGGFGITYRVRDKLDQVFALKECFPRQFAVRQGFEVYAADSSDEAGLADCLDRFLREAKALSSLARLGSATDGVVRVATFCEAYRTAYIVMELLSGQTLEDFLKTSPGGLDQLQLNDILLRLLLALRAVHGSGMLHRDIKPSNIFLRDDGRPVFIDFGATRVVDKEHTLAFTQIITELYSPIEQFGGQRPGPFSDLYALGMCCYRAIGGKPSDAMTRQHMLARGAPDPMPSAMTIGAGRYKLSLLRTIDAMLEIKAEDRPQTAGEALSMLTSIDGDTSSIARKVQEAVDHGRSPARQPLSPLTPSEPAPVSHPGRRGLGQAQLVGVCALCLIFSFCATYGVLDIWTNAHLPSMKAAPPSDTANSTPR